MGALRGGDKLGRTSGLLRRQESAAVQRRLLARHRHGGDVH
jgi:hypothetical protein